MAPTSAAAKITVDVPGDKKEAVENLVADLRKKLSSKIGWM